MLQIVKELKDFKENNGLSYKDLESAMGINHSTIQNWISGSKLPNNKNLKKIALFLERQPEPHEETSECYEKQSETVKNFIKRMIEDTDLSYRNGLQIYELAIKQLKIEKSLNRGNE